MAESSTTTDFLDLILDAWKNNSINIETIKKIFSKRHKILILGASGAGKSQLIKSLTEVTPEAISYRNRTQFIDKTNLNISNKQFQFIEAPGDVAKEPVRAEAYRKAIKDGVSAIINVTAYGYHEYMIDDLNTVITPNFKVKKSYLQTHQKTEIEMLSEWEWNLLNQHVTNNLLTVITKADTWWDDHNKIIKHYNSGSYAQAITSPNVHHAVLPYSSVKHNFYDKAPLSQQFNDEIQNELKNNFQQHLITAISDLNS